jgi:hypothetical protein
MAINQKPFELIFSESERNKIFQELKQQLSSSVHRKLENFHNQFHSFDDYFHKIPEVLKLSINKKQVRS